MKSVVQIILQHNNYITYLFIMNINLSYVCFTYIVYRKRDIYNNDIM